MLEKTKEFLTRKRLWPLADVLVFVVITWGFHELWWMFFPQIMAVPLFVGIADWLANAVYLASAWVDVHVFRMDVLLFEKNVIHFVTNSRGIVINETCSGFKQMYQVLVLFLLFPGPWKHKLWYIPMGIAAMFLINIARVVGLSFTMIYWPAQWDFIHLWVLRPFYYLVLFLLWVIWVEKFGGTKKFALGKKI